MQTCTLRDLVPEGAAAAIETDPDVARLKSSADLVKAIETAVGHYEEPPTGEMVVETPWADVWLDADDWAEAFEAPRARHSAQRGARPGLGGAARDPGRQPRRRRRAAATCSAGRCAQNEELRAAFNRAWPLLDPAGVVGDLWSVPGYLRKCAPWLDPDEVAALQRADARAWTVSDLPLLDAARQRIGDPEASRRRRRREAARRRRARADATGSSTTSSRPTTPRCW